jgi:hypothetical protein
MNEEKMKDEKMKIRKWENGKIKIRKTTQLS